MQMRSRLRGVAAIVVGLTTGAAWGCHSAVDAPEATLDLGPDSLRLWVGESGSVTALGSSIGIALEYRSTDDAVATVSTGGEVEGRGQGQAWIVASATDGRWAPDSVPVAVDDWRVSAAQLTMTASIAKAASSYLGTVTVRNQGASTVRFGYGELCLPYMVLTSNGDGRVWNQLSWWNQQPGACKWVAYEAFMGPGDAREITVPAAETGAILGDSLAAGVFTGEVRFVLAHWERAGTSLQAMLDSTIRLPVGGVDVQPPE